MSGKRGMWLLALLVFPLMASAAGFDVTAGPSVTSGQRVTAALFASAFGEPPADDRAYFEPIGTLGWLDSRNTRSDDLDHQALLAAGGIRLVSADRHWFVSEQLAVTSTRTDALSSRFEFMTSGGWQGGRFVVLLRHVSNAHIVGSGKNLGETMLLAGVRF